eukprot:gene11901-5307_t
MEQIIVEVKSSEEKKPIYESDEKLLKSFKNIKFHLQDNDFGFGELFVAQKNIYWINEKENENNYKIEFKNILVHATSKFNSKLDCLYCQLNSEVNEEDLIELRLIGKDEKEVFEMYETFSEGALLNPDEDDANEELIFNPMEVHNNLKSQKEKQDISEEETLDDNEQPPLKKK